MARSNHTWKLPHSLAMLVALVLLTSATAVRAQDDILQQLDLSAEQQTRINQLTDGFRAETRPIIDDINRLLKKEKELRKASPVDEDALRQVMKQRSDKEIELSLALNRFQDHVEQILTPKQRQTLKELKAKHKHQSSQ